MSDLFQGGPNEHSMDLGFGPDPQREAPDNSGQGTPAGQTFTFEQVQALLQSLGQQRQQADYAAAISGQAVPEPVGLPEINFDDLPDPRTNFDAFRQEFAARQNAAYAEVLNAAETRFAAAQNTNDLLNDAWAMMRERYPQLDENDDTRQLVAQAREREIANLAARGLDWQAAVRANMEGAVEAVAQRAMTSLNRLRGVQPDAEPEDAGRTDMLSGGNSRPSRPAAPPKQASFVDEIKAIQRKEGIY